jgi:hypothetical protein
LVIQAVARRLDGEVVHALLLQPRQQFVDLHRIGRGVGKREFAFRPYYAHRSQTCRRFSQRRPDLAQESDNGGLALGAGDSGDDLGLSGEEGGRIACQSGAGIVFRNKPHAQRRNIAGKRRRTHHRHRAARHRVLHKARAVGLCP